MTDDNNHDNTIRTQVKSSNICQKSQEITPPNEIVLHDGVIVIVIVIVAAAAVEEELR
jgi:hypothetical protein